MLHTFMMAAREAGFTIKQFRDNPRCIRDAFLQEVETYGYDGVVVGIDTSTLAGAVGLHLNFLEAPSARCAAPGLKRLQELQGLALPVSPPRAPSPSNWIPSPTPAWRARPLPAA